MNGNSIFLDTNIVLYLLGGDKTLIQILEDKRLTISFITQLELLSYKGISSADYIIINKFLSECVIVDINNVIKEKTVELRKNNNLKLPDCIIIASAMYLKMPLITADKQFRKINGADLIIYEK
ncbi:MAG: PilT protein domain protein [Ignavibacteria bacterium]|nr:MAG: PilT protein domain protein [Ignavibacteria bacterium]KAF0152719.1 MAG: PilT protein domain protein [Ignavibacteria bacterium]